MSDGVIIALINGAITIAVILLARRQSQQENIIILREVRRIEAQVKNGHTPPEV